MTKRVALIVVFFAGCLEPVVEPLADGGVSIDAGVSVDGGVSVDAGVWSDAGVSSDAGASIDGGMSSDAGVSVDAGVSSDAGMSPDAGAAVDAGLSCWPSPARSVTVVPWWGPVLATGSSGASNLWTLDGELVSEREVEGLRDAMRCTWDSQLFEGVFTYTDSSAWALSGGVLHRALISSGFDGTRTNEYPRIFHIQSFLGDGGAVVRNQPCTVLTQMRLDAGPGRLLGFVQGPLSTSNSQTFWGTWRENDLGIRFGSRPPPDLGQVFWWDSVTRDAGFSPFVPAVSHVIATPGNAAHALTVTDAGAFVSLVTSDGGISLIQTWTGAFADCRFRVPPNRLWCTSSDQRTLLAIEADSGTRSVHDGGLDRLYLVRTVGETELVLFFANGSPFYLDSFNQPDGGSRIFATRAEWPQAVLMIATPSPREFALGDLGGGRVRVGEWLGTSGNPNQLSWADYCFPASGP